MNSTAGKTEYYHSTDPLENLKFFVSIREVNRPKDFNSSETAESRPFFTLKSLVSWQQKLFSPREIVDYLHNKHDLQHRKGTAVQIETRSILSRLEASGTNIQSLLQPVIFFTYIDRDRVQVEESISTVQSNAQQFQNRHQRRFSGNRENSFKVMHFCLATDIQIDRMLQEKYGEYEQYYNEHILCSVKIFQDGVVEVSPGLSKIILEPVNELPSDLSAEYHSALNPASTSNTAAASLFFSDHTVENGLKRGFRVSSLRIRSSEGSDFEYAVYNARDIFIPQQLDDLLLKQELMDSIRSSEVRGIGAQSISAQWKQDPSSRDFLYSLQAEIVSAAGFEEGDRIGVTYHLYHPSEWQLRTGDITDGEINQQSSANTSNRLMAVFNETESRGLLQGSTQIARRGAGYSLYIAGNSRLHLRGWYSSRLGRLLAGFIFWFVSILSVVEGVGNGLWILPCLLLYFLTQMVTSPTTQYFHSSQHSGELNDLSKQVFFNYLMNFNFDVNDFNFEKQQLFQPTSQFPILFLQVFSYSSPSWLFNRRRCLLGYATCQLPLTAGEFSINVKTWRPRGSVRHQLHEFFIGDAISLKDFTFPRDFDTITKSLNRFGVLTESMGNLLIRGQVIVTDSREVERRRKTQEEILIHQSNSNRDGSVRPIKSLNQRLNSFKMKKSVEEIMKSFKDTRLAGKGEAGKLSAASIINRLRSSRETKTVGVTSERSNNPISSSSGQRPSIKSILESINANAKTNKTAEMIQRLRSNRKTDESGDEKIPVLHERRNPNEEDEDEQSNLLK